MNILALYLARAWGADYFSLGSWLPVGGVRLGEVLFLILWVYCVLCAHGGWFSSSRPRVLGDYVYMAVEGQEN